MIIIINWKQLSAQPRAGLNDNDYQYQLKMIINIKWKSLSIINQKKGKDFFPYLLFIKIYILKFFHLIKHLFGFY